MNTSPGNFPDTRRPVNARLILDAEAVRRALARIAHEIIERTPSLDALAFVGLPTRGFPIAQRLAVLLHEIHGVQVPVGQMDITFHRDDLLLRTPIPQSTHIPFDITNRVILLVDDVLFTGRSVRAALNALNDFGRPSAIQLAALVDRGHRQLPIRADYVGKNIPTALTDQVRVKMQEVDGLDAVEVLV
jgi:pyrimidine operon attenuation protein/uracil phosphoribosyltransferase